MAVTGQVGQAECGTWFYAIFAGTLQIACYTLVILGLVFGGYFEGYNDIDTALLWFCLAGLSLIINLCYGCCTDSTRFMCNKMKLEECIGNIHTAIKNPPTITMHIQNYHYESETRTDSKGNTHTVTKRVNTHSCRAPFLFSEWLDKSPPPDTLNYVDVIHLTRLFTHKII